MNSLSFPDINVWFALVVSEHGFHQIAAAWWKATDAEVIGISRFTQLGLLRLLTTSAAMNGKPRTMLEAWSVYNQLFQDGRVVYFSEPSGVDSEFHRLSAKDQPSPKAWADAFLLACARCHGGELITFDQALLNQPNCQVLQPTP